MYILGKKSVQYRSTLYTFPGSCTYFLRTTLFACNIPCIFCDIVNGVIYIETKVHIVLLSSCISTNFPYLAFSLLYLTIQKMKIR